MEDSAVSCARQARLHGASGRAPRSPAPGDAQHRSRPWKATVLGSWDRHGGAVPGTGRLGGQVRPGFEDGLSKG